MVYLTVSLTFLLLYTTPTYGDNLCGDWDQYKDEKCIKVLNGTLKFDDAIKACHLVAPEANLLSIRTAEEQVFTENLLFQKLKVHDTIWLGGKFDKVCAISC